MESTTKVQDTAALQTNQCQRPAEDLFQYLTKYAHERPDVVALWAFGIGFVLGWRLRWW